MVTSLGGLEVRPHEDLLISSEDIRAMFYIVGLGPRWRPFLAFGKEVPDQLRPWGDSRPHVLTSRVLPMGFINSVAVAQHIHREIVKRALSKVGPGAECEFRRDSTFPQSEVGYQVYLDNFDLLEKTNSSAAEVLKGSRAPSSDALRREYEKLKVPANQKKSVSRASTAEVQGALVDGVRNIAYPKPEKFVRYLRASFFLLCQTVASLKQLQIALGGLVYLFQFRRPLMANLDECWSCLVELGRQDPSGTAMFPIPTEVKKELWLSLSLAPLAYICFGAKFSEVVTCSDASEHGGGVCQSVGLTPMGQQAAFKTVRGEQPDLLGDDGVLVISLFDGIGACRVALELIEANVCGYIAVECAAPARRVVERAFPSVLFEDDVTQISEANVLNWARRFQRAKVVLVSAGPPCQGVSQLNASRKGALHDPRTKLFQLIQPIVEWVKIHMPWASVRKLVENVFSMSEGDSFALCGRCCRTEPMPTASVVVV